MVRRQPARLPRAGLGRPLGSQRDKVRLPGRRRVARGHRARQRRRDGHDTHGEAGHRNRARRAARGGAPQEARNPRRAARAAERPRDPPAGAGRLSGSAKHLRPARAPHRLQARHSPNAWAHDAGGRAGDQDNLLRQARRRGHRALREGDGRARPAPHAARRHRLRPGGSRHRVWAHRRESLDLPGRHPPRRAGGRRTG